MKAVVMTAVGGPEVLRVADVPEPRIEHDTQIKVQLKAAGVNPVDAKLRQRGLFYPDALPAILGCDGAGVVTEVGPAVTRHRPGDAVWFCNGGLGGEPGTYAEFTVVEESVARPKPRSLDFAHAAAAPLVLITAWEALYDRARLQADATALVHAGAGGVGHIAIQLAKLAGAAVCTTVSSPEKAEFIRDLGADEAIVYTREDFVTAALRWTSGTGVDVALDSVGGETLERTFAAMAHYGDLVTLLDPGGGLSWKEARNRNLRIGLELMLTPMLYGLTQARAHQGEILDRCAQWFDEGRLKIHVSRTLPLARAAEAHREIEAGHTQGKLVLTLNH